MKAFLFIMPMIFWMGTGIALASPSAGEVVCVGKINASRSEFSFQIRPLQEGCKPEENLLELHRHANGTYYLLPQGTSLFPETKPAPSTPLSDKPY